MKATLKCTARLAMAVVVLVISAMPALAKVKVVATISDLGSLVEIEGERVFMFTDPDRLGAAVRYVLERGSFKRNEPVRVRYATDDDGYGVEIEFENTSISGIFSNEATVLPRRGLPENQKQTDGGHDNTGKKQKATAHA